MTALVGSIDEVSRSGVRGWVRDPSFPDAPVALLVTADDQLLERVVANRHRPDVERAGFGSGRFGFSVVFNPPLLPSRSWLVRICSEVTGEDIPGSPVRLSAADEFGEQARAAIAALLGSAETESELDERIGFLSAQRERLRQLQADRVVGRTLRHAAASVRRALVIDDHGLPEPDRDGGSGVLVSHMRSLQRLGHDVTFTAPAMQDGAAADALRRAGITVCHEPTFGSVEEVLRRCAEGFDLVYLHRVATASAYAGLVRRYQPRARLVYSVADLHHLRLARQAAVERRRDLMVEAQRVRAEELWAARTADAVITHSPVEAELLRQIVPAASVHVMAWSIPCRPTTASFARRRGIAFIGNFRHAPNVAAAVQLRDEIMPAVYAADPAIPCRLVGRDLPPSLQPPQPGLEVVGRVPDLQSVFNSVRLTVAPLRFGAGLKAKVMESLAAGVPCVCSTAAAEGLALPQSLREFIVSDTGTWVQAILHLHNDKARNATVAKLGAEFARLAFSEAQLDKAMRGAVGLVEAAPAQASTHLRPATTLTETARA